MKGNKMKGNKTLLALKDVETGQDKSFNLSDLRYVPQSSLFIDKRALDLVRLLKTQTHDLEGVSDTPGCVDTYISINKAIVLESEALFLEAEAGVLENRARVCEDFAKILKSDVVVLKDEAAALRLKIETERE